jgi:hypothetical protein
MAEKVEGIFDESDDPFEGIAELIGELVGERCHNRIGIEFECGDCCKKVTNGAELEFKCPNLIILEADEDEFLKLKIFSDGKLVDEQKLKAIIVPKKRICAIEIEPRKEDPCEQPK